MAQVTKRKLSGSTDGRGVLITTTATAGTLVHTAVTGVVAGTWDEIWLYAYNSDTVDRVVTVEWGGVTIPSDNIKVTVPFQQGRFLLVDGAVLQNASVVRVFASAANVVVVSGFVNQITA